MKKEVLRILFDNQQRIEASDYPATEAVNLVCNLKCVTNKNYGKVEKIIIDFLLENNIMFNFNNL